MKLRRLADFGPAFVLTLTLLAFWELYVRAGQISAQVLPAPTAIIQALFDNWNVIYDNTLQTLLETVLGMGIANAAGDSAGHGNSNAAWPSAGGHARYLKLAASSNLPFARHLTDHPNHCPCSSAAHLDWL